MNRNILVLGILLLSLNIIQAQDQKNLKGPTRDINYDLTGALNSSFPCYIDEQGKTHKIGNKFSSGFISNAILRQLTKDPELLKACSDIVSNALGKEVRDSIGVMMEIIQGAGYWMFCPPNTIGNGSDVRYLCSTEKVAYQIHVDSRKGEIYVAEIKEGKALEINYAEIGVKHYEGKAGGVAEAYEKLVPKKNGECAEPVRLPDPTLSPVAVIKPSTLQGTAPLTVNFSGALSHDKDEDGNTIVKYSWDFGERGASNGVNATQTFTQVGTHPVILTVTDDEEETDQESIIITVDPVLEPCYTMVYTISKCEGKLDTLDQSSIQVPCDAVPEPKVVWVPCPCCDDPDPVVADKDTSGFVLAGGPIYIQNDGQLLEYALGLDIQIRYPFKNRDHFHFVLDGTYFPNRRSNPLDDRPHLWSELRDVVDPNTGLPLHWFRGTRRGSASFALGIDYKPKKRLLLKGLYMQGLIGLERTFNQIEASDPRKDPSNEFIGFDLGVFFIETRLGLRKKHLEVFIGGRFLEESRPFSLVQPNPLGGTHHRKFDNTIHAGIAVWY